MSEKKLKRVFAGIYRRYDYAYIRVLTVVDDIDTGSKVVFFRFDDIKHNDGKNYAMSIESFCEDIEHNGKIVPKFTRCTQHTKSLYYENELDELGFAIPRKHRKKRTSSECKIRECRQCTTYEDYAKDICAHYNEDINRYNKSVEAKRCVGIMGAGEFKALKEDIYFTRDCFNTALKDYHTVFKKRYVKGLSIRKCAEEIGISKGSVEYKEKKMFSEFAALLKHRDEQDGMIRLKMDDDKTDDLESLWD